MIERISRIRFVGRIIDAWLVGVDAMAFTEHQRFKQVTPEGTTLHIAAFGVQFGGAAIATGLSGGNLGQVLKSGLIAGASAFAFAGLGSITPGSAAPLGSAAPSILATMPPISPAASRSGVSIQRYHSTN